MKDEVGRMEGWKEPILPLKGAECEKTLCLSAST